MKSAFTSMLPKIAVFPLGMLIWSDREIGGAFPILLRYARYGNLDHPRKGGGMNAEIEEIVAEVCVSCLASSVSQLRLSGNFVSY